MLSGWRVKRSHRCPRESSLAQWNLRIVIKISLEFSSGREKQFNCGPAVNIVRVFRCSDACIQRKGTRWVWSEPGFRQSLENGFVCG